MAAIIPKPTKTLRSQAIWGRQRRRSVRRSHRCSQLSQRPWVRTASGLGPGWWKWLFSSKQSVMKRLRTDWLISPRNLDTLLLYLISAFGVWSRTVTTNDLTKTDWTLTGQAILRAAIMAGVTLPLLYRALGQRGYLKSNRTNIVRYFLAFQNGFFWEALLRQLQP